MKIELALSHVEQRSWKGLCLVDGELNKVIIYPGSATEDWEAEISPYLYVELTEGKLKEAIERAHIRYNSSQSMTRRSDEFDDIPQEALEEIMKIINQSVDQEGGEQG